MPKNFITALFIIIVILLLGGGIFFFFQNQNKTKLTGVKENTPNTTAVNAEFMKSAGMKCEYTNQEGIKTEVYVKNGSARADYVGENTEESQSVIITKDNIYIWDTNGGLLININNDSQNLQRKEYLVSSFEKYRQYCKNTPVSDSVFTPPAGVKFEEYSKAINKVIPTLAAESGMTEEQFRKYLQQRINLK